MLRDRWAEEQHNCLKEQDFLAAVFDFQIEQGKSLYKLLLPHFPTAEALSPFAPSRPDIKLIVRVWQDWNTSWEMSCSPGNWAEQQQIKGTAGTDKATIPGEQDYGDTLLSPLLDWKRTGARQGRAHGQHCDRHVVSCHASAVVSREHSSAWGQVTPASV